MEKYLFSSIAVLILYGILIPVTGQDIILPAPDKIGGKPLMQALNERQTIRTFTKDSLTQQQLSDLLWAGWGINRADQKKRTAPSAMNVQEIDIYAALPSGLYIYVAETHMLRQINNKDVRKLTGTQDFVAEAALNLVYVADMGRAGKKEGDEIKDSELLASAANTGFIAQNVYLYCASANLGCVVRGMVPKEQLALEMGLRSNQVIIMAQTIGVPQR